MSEPLPWELPLGSRVLDQEQTEFRVWAPSATTITLWVAGRGVVLREIGHGVHEVVTTARPGDDYWYEVDGRRLPDPCSRWQPGPARALARARDDSAGAV